MLRRTFLKRGGPIKRKKKKPEQIQEQKEQYEEDWKFYTKIWSKRLHICQVCSTHLGNIIKNYFFDHLLEKQTYPELRYEEENIALVCYECHGCKNSRPRLKHTELIEAAKKRFL